MCKWLNMKDLRGRPPTPPKSLILRCLRRLPPLPHTGSLVNKYIFQTRARLARDLLQKNLPNHKERRCA